MGIDSKSVPRPIANIMKKQQINQSYAAAVKGNTVTNKTKQGNVLDDKVPVSKIVNDVNKNIEERLNHLETRFDKLEAVLNKIVNHLEKGKNPVVSLPTTPMPNQNEITPNEELSLQNPINWNQFDSNPIGMSTPANNGKNLFYQPMMTETPAESSNEKDLILSLRTRCDKLESLAAKLITQMNNNLSDEEQITIDFNTL